MRRSRAGNVAPDRLKGTKRKTNGDFPMKRTSILSAAILAAALPLMAQGQDAQATASATT